MALEEHLNVLLGPVKEHAIAAFLWGSHATGAAHEHSDVDVCIVAGPGADATTLHRLVLRHVISEKIDVKIFEDLPLYLKGEVLDHGILLWARDVSALEDHLWRYRKLWRDARHRVEVTADDMRRALAR